MIRHDLNYLSRQVEGFPSPDEVRTFYVEHDIDGSEEDTSVLQFILTDKRIPANKEEVMIHPLQLGSPMNVKLKQLAACLVVGR
jgi:hypothetical protein